MKAKRVALCGMLIAVAMILSYIESLFPLFITVPGVKMGLPNVVIVFALYMFGIKEAAAISAIRVFLTALLFWNIYTFAFSIAGACVSLTVMAVLYKSGRFAAVGVSVAGAVAHNAAQIVVAVIVLNTGVIAFWFPVLCVTGVVTGVCIGLIAALLVRRAKNTL